jgi:hypothetical protein
MVGLLVLDTRFAGADQHREASELFRQREGARDLVGERELPPEAGWPHGPQIAAERDLDLERLVAVEREPEGQPGALAAGEDLGAELDAVALPDVEELARQHRDLALGQRQRHAAAQQREAQVGDHLERPEPALVGALLVPEQRDALARDLDEARGIDGRDQAGKLAGARGLLGIGHEARNLTGPRCARDEDSAAGPFRLCLETTSPCEARICVPFVLASSRIGVTSCCDRPCSVCCSTSLLLPARPPRPGG